MRNRALDYTYARANWGLKFRPDANTILWLPGQDDAYSATIRDRSGKGNDGTITGAVWEQTGQGLWGLNFDGGDDEITIASDTSLNVTTDATFEWWANYDGNDSGTRPAVWDKGATEVYSITKETLQMFIYFNGLTTYNFINNFYIQDSWYHYIVTLVAGGALAAYRNGVAKTWGRTNPDVDQVLPVTASPLTIMENVARGSNLGGLSALFRLHSRALSAAEVLSHYNQERHLFGV